MLNHPPTPELVASTLAHIPADCDRDQWARIGMAIKSEFPSDEGFDLFDTWSQSSDCYDPKDARDTWRSIREGGGVNIGTLFYAAKQHGWTPPRNGQAPAKPDPVQVAKRQLERLQRTAKEEAERDQRQQQVAVQAKAEWDAAKPCPADHPYLKAKGIKAHGTKVDSNGYLMVPMFDKRKVLVNIERINPANSKDKKGLKDGQRTGVYYAVGSNDQCGIVTLSEGFATAMSVHECTGYPSAVAFGKSNLTAAALMLREKFPQHQIVIVADDEGHGGMEAARKAAEAVGGCLAVPDFGPDRPQGAKDANDLHQIAGAEAVKRCIDAAQPVNADGDQAADQWPEPTPLPDALPAVMAFDSELLPETLRPWVMDIAHRMQCPVDFPAVAALVAISSLIGARAVVQPKARDDWQVVPNLWGVAIGRAGVKKSPALNEALKPLLRLQSAEFEAWQIAHESWEIDCKVADMAADSNEKKAKSLAVKDPQAARALLTPTDGPAEPVARRFLVNDATVEKLGELLMQNPWGTLSYRDELYGLLTNLDRQGQEGSRSFYLQAYDGNQGYTFDRIMRGTTHIPRVCLAMIGGIQPGRIQEYVRGAVAGGSGDDGLLQRFGLAVWPDVAGEFVHVDQWPDTPAKQAAWAVYERLAQLQPGSETDPHVWRFDAAAQALFVEWLVPFEMEIRGDELHPAMVSHLSKYRKLVPALALVFALIDTPDSEYLIGERELFRALAWSEYLRTHAERLYSAAVVPETTAAVTLLTKIRAGKLTDRDGALMQTFTPRQVAVKHWAGLDSPEAVRKAADLLADYDWLKRDAVQSGDQLGRGRQSDRYAVNPAALKARSV